MRARGKERKLAWQGLCVLAIFCRGVTGGGCVCVGAGDADDADDVDDDHVDMTMT